MNLPPLICYTHHKCFDILPVYMGQAAKHYPGQSFVLSDVLPTSRHLSFLYDDNDPFYLQWNKSLAAFPGNTFIATLEDEILYGDVDVEAVDRYTRILEASQRFGDGLRYSYIRLIKSGCVDLGDRRITDTLYEVPVGPANFSLQATLWWKPDYMAIMEAGQCKSVRDEPDFADPANEIGIRGLYHFAGERQRGRNHTDSFVFPHMATGINKGKFNSEYRDEWLTLLKEYRIDPNKRGWL